MLVDLTCPECQTAGRLDPSQEVAWQCPRCNRLLRLSGPASPSELHSCLVCGNGELYKKKNFPHWLGLTILTAACVGSIPFYYLYHQWVTWAILIGSAAFDGLLYCWVGDVIVCYRCLAGHRRFVTLPEHRPFDLGTGEKYRQERIRLRDLQFTKTNGSRFVDR